jgi:adenylate cyclase
MAEVPERKLTTILSADVAGYARLTEQDEAGTLARLKTYRDAFAEKIAGHRGRVVSTAGDALLAEFPSVVNAVDCAVRVQRDLSERNEALPSDSRMAFRIGINLGDVMVEGADLFGEGVNVAARLQALAEPGGILVSGPVFQQVRNKLTLAFDYLGPQMVKNISESVPAYRVLLGDSAPPFSQREKAPAERADEGLEASRSRSRRSPRDRLMRRAMIVGSLILFFFAIDMLTPGERWWFQWPSLSLLLIFALRTAFVGWR